MSYTIGIDLGTTNSTVSVYRKGMTETLDVEGQNSLPSVVSFLANGNILVGQSAKNRILMDPDNTISSSKRFIGDPSISYNIQGKKFTPTSVASHILKKLVKSARNLLGQEVWDVVITVPAYFTEAQREETKRAGEEAGLNVLRLLPEPTAAAISYGLDKNKDQLIMVYDLGGGTFDVSILEVKGNEFRVKAVDGDSALGGDDFDKKIVEWAAGKLKNQTGIDIFSDQGDSARKSLQQMKEAAENVKKTLCESSSARFSLPNVMGQSLDLEISLSEFNELITPLVEKTIKKIQSVMSDANLTAMDIDRVILVGGSTKNKIIKEKVTQCIKEPFIAERVDEAVSNGAAIVAASLSLPEEDMLPIEISDVTPHSLGLEMLNEKEEVVFCPIIKRQTAYPCKDGILGSTVFPNQEAVALKVYRGEDKDPGENTFLGELGLPISSPKNEIVPVGAIFELDKDGIIHFTAIEFSLSIDSKSVFDYAAMNEGKLHLDEVERLMLSNKVKTRSVEINSN
jgi:molecular chaperone DnaK